MYRLKYPDGDPRKIDAIVPDQSIVELLDRTPNLVRVRWGGREHFVNPTFLYDSEGVPLEEEEIHWGQW